MNRIFIPCETRPGETRIAMLPALAGKLVKLGAAVEIEPGLGRPLHLEDAAFTAAGATVAASRAEGLARADLVLMLNKPVPADIAGMRKGAVLAAYLDPLTDFDTVRALAFAGLSAVSMELIPRTTIAQKMDALSSQASLAGYAAVLLAAGRLNRILPMMMTPAGTLSPAKFFIIGAGVAGLQAIATAKRLGARVEAFDTRPVVEDQVKSLGAKFLKVDLGETGQTAGGYAKELTPEQLEKQRAAMAQACAQADVVITTAQVFGRKAPRILTAEMVAGMKPGSLIVDMAVETGGNVEGSVAGRDVVINGVTLIGQTNLAGTVPMHASQMYASNVANFVEHFWSKERKAFDLNREDEIMKGALVTHDGAVVHNLVKERMG